MSLKQLVKNTLTFTRSNFGHHLWPTEKHKLWILMYHRILPQDDPRFSQEEPGMIVTPTTLDMHFTELKKHFEIVSLNDWINRRERGEQLPDKACAITFDDGWYDNYEYAYPILKAHQLPATLFAVADKVNTSYRFWPNIVLGLIAMQTVKRLSKHPMFEGAAKLAAQDYSREAAAACISDLKQFSEDEIFEALESINWKKAFKKEKPALMGWKELADMQESELVTIGSHTSNHRRLDMGLSDDLLSEEIVDSRYKLQEAMSARIDLFCFPNGNYDHRTLDLVSQNYSAAVTTKKGINCSETLNQHELYRIPLHEEICDTPGKLRARLAGW